MSATMDMSTYGNRVSYFISSVSSYGMSEFQAAMCLLKAKELRSAYTESNDIQNAEDNILNELRYWLGGLSYRVHPDTFVAVHWEAVVGGVEEGDDNILYIVPPGGHPIAVPLPYQTEGEQTPIAELAQAIAEAPVPQEEVPVPQGVEQILDAWSKPVEPKKQDTEVFEARYSSWASYMGPSELFLRLHRCGGATEDSTPLFSQLNRLRTEARATPAIIPNWEVTENMPVISPPQGQRSLDLLREKERKAKYKRDRTRKR